MSRARNIFIGIAVLGASLAAAAPASAQLKPYVSSAPTIKSSPPPYVGNTLTAQGGTAGPAGVTTGYQWLRCETPSESSCGFDDIIHGADKPTYRLTAADRSHYIRVAKYACRWCPWDLVYKLSAATKKVTDPPGPTPTPTPPPKFTPTPTPTKPPVSVTTPTPTPTPSAPVEVIAEVSPPADVQPSPSPLPTPDGTVLAAADTKRPKMLRPYPTVRIRGVLTSGGARISLLTVKAPKGARIAARCTGKGCPTSRVAQVARLVHIRQFERELRAGIKLTITISKPGYISKVTTISIRKGKAPLRSDLCQTPPSRKLARCPR